ncbi:MAG: glycosyltransferase family 4 protein [Myxococcales bacterium]|nr:glycosyltransferase family 4 protein [Myxococcales bacterium]
MSSARFRVRQYLPHLSDLGVEVTESPSPVSLWQDEPPRIFSHGRWLRGSYRALFTARAMTARVPGLLRSMDASLVWFQKELIPGFATFERWMPKPYIFDVDDAVWLQGPWGTSAVAAIAQRAQLVIAGSRAIADWFAPYAKRVELLPTPVDTDEFFPVADRIEDQRCVVGWIGSQSSLTYLEQKETMLAAFLEQAPLAELRIVCDRSPRFSKLPPNRWSFVRWSPSVGPFEVQRMDIGLMPLPDIPAARYKCGLKMLQYMACGIPVVVSPVGFNDDLIRAHKPGLGPQSDAEWFEALLALYRSPELRRDMGERGQKAILAFYSLSSSARRLADIMQTAVAAH